MMSGSSPSAQALVQSGFQWLQQRRLQEAWNAFHAALAKDPDNAVAHHMVGLIALQTGQLQLGVDSLRRSIALNPMDPAAYSNLGNGLRELGRPDEALDAYGKALALAPAFLDALNNRAVLYSRLDRFGEALADYDLALANGGARSPALHNHRANALRLLGRRDEALEACAAALRLEPRHADAHLNRATILGELGRHAEAIAAYDACLAVAPDRVEALYYSGTSRLALGDYARGWAAYEARLKLQGRRRVAPEVAFPQPAWDGLAPLAGRTLLLHSEQGLGDTLQFCRYADLAKARGATVILQVEAPLVRLLTTLKGADRVIAKGEPLPPFDLHASIMSLPHAFRTTLETIPAQIPYLSADPDKAAAWNQRLGPRTRPRVGLVWSGGVRPERPDLERRTVPLPMLAALAGADVDFISLQKGEPAESDLRALAAAGWSGPALLDVASELHDFSDTAALMQTLDLVISTCTATAHLAGALGKPVWILNPFHGCWRWMQDRPDSPWYPTARLFRQKTLGDWAPVVDDVVAALNGLRA